MFSSMKVEPPYMATQWDVVVQSLTAYKNQHGDCNVAQKYKDEDAILGWWVETQRMQQSQLSLEQRDQLTVIGGGEDGCLPAG